MWGRGRDGERAVGTGWRWVRDSGDGDNVHPYILLNSIYQTVSDFIYNPLMSILNKSIIGFMQVFTCLFTKQNKFDVI